MESINELIRGSINKDPQSQRALYQRYYGYALKMAFRYVYEYDVAKDVVNDSFVKIFNSIDKYRSPQDGQYEKVWMGWIKKIVVNTAIDELRKKQWAPEHGLIPESVWEMEDRHQDIDKLLWYKDLIILVKELLPEYRAVFNMYVIDGYSHVEISDILNIPVGTSKSRLARAKIILQKNIIRLQEIKVHSI